MNEARPCRIILMGMMGSGKTTLGHLLSARTGWPYRDNDELVLAATGRTARELAAAGTAGLREAEAQALLLALGTTPPAIVACAAGVITDPKLRDRMRREGMVVWLRASPEVLAERASGATHRPWVDGDAAEWLATRVEERAPLYREVAALEIDTESAEPEALADRVIQALRATSCGAWLGTPHADA